MKTSKIISKKRIDRIRAQGHHNLNDTQISEISFGNRFAYILCSAILLIGVIDMNFTILIAMLIIAFLAVITPYHPFDYIYNYGIRFIINKPKTPKRSRQLKLACSIATTFIAITIYLFYTSNFTAGYITGACLLFSAILVSTTDICIPSIIYNKINNIK